MGDVAPREDTIDDPVVLTARGDEAKCSLDGLPCPLKDRCARHLRPPNPWRQWYSTFRDWRTDRCQGFEPV